MSTINAPDRAAWLEARRGGLGASDVSAALGVNPWKSQFALWAEKCGLLPDDDLAAVNEAVEWGLALERPIGEKFAERTGRGVMFPKSTEIRVHPDMPFLRCTLDAITHRSPGEGPGALEIKTTSAWNSADWADGAVPLHYQIQLMAQLAVCDFSWGTVCVLIGGQRLVYRDIERDDSFLDAAIPHLEKFWHHVETRTAPPVDASPVTAKILAKLHPDDSGETVELPPEAIGWHEELARVKEKIKALEEIKALHENQLKAAIGEHSFGQLSNGLVYSWKTQERAEHVVKASKYRVLRQLKG